MEEVLLDLGDLRDPEGPEVGITTPRDLQMSPPALAEVILIRVAPRIAKIIIGTPKTIKTTVKDLIMVL